jgi:hypothetical protein
MRERGNDWAVRSHRGRAARQDAAYKWQAPEPQKSFVRYALTAKAQALLDAFAAERGAYPMGGAR